MKLGDMSRWWYCLVILALVSACDRGGTADFDEQKFKDFLSARYFELPAQETRRIDFDYQLINGQRERFADSKGKIILLNFWATWCFPCKKEMPDLETLARKMEGENFRILAVNSGETRQKIESFLERTPHSFDVVLDEHREISNLLEITGLPTTYLLDPDLKVIGKIVGPFDWKNELFIDYLKKFSRSLKEKTNV